VLEGKVLRANDSMVSRINSKEIQDHRTKYGEEPLWTNSIFSGMPAYLISTKYPGNLFKSVDAFLRIFKMPVSVLFLSMTGFYVLLLIFGLDPWLSVTGAIAYGFSSFTFLILAAGHNTQAIALAYMAPMIGGIYYAYWYNAVKGALFTAVILALELTANHPQITYYAVLCLLVFVIVEFIYALRTSATGRFFKTSAILAIPFIIAVGINFASLYTVWEYGKYSIRGKSDLTIKTGETTSGLNKDYILFWSYGTGETLNLLVPNFRGGSSKPFDRNSETYKALRQNNALQYADYIQKYWGSQPGTDGPHYMGAIVIFLFILGLVLVKGPEKWWLLAASLLSVMLAWGKNLMFFSDLFIGFFPGYNKFRAVTMILVIAQFCIPLLGFLALRNIFNGLLTKDEILKGIKIAGGTTLGLLLIFLLLPGIAGSFLGPNDSQFPEWLRTAVVADRKALLRVDSLRSFFFIAAAVAVITGFTFNRLKREYAISLLTLLILIDMWPVDKRYLNAGHFEKASVLQKTFNPTIADAMILKDQSSGKTLNEGRVLNMTVSVFNDNSPTSYFHHSIGGYHGAKLRRYQELIDTAISRDLMTIQAAFQAVSKSANANTVPFRQLQDAFRTTNALNMLNAKYLIYNPDASPLVNPYALGNAWFAQKAVIVKNADEELSSVVRFDPSSEALIDEKFRDLVKSDSFSKNAGDTIYLTSYKANELIYKYTAGSEKLAVFSEIYYPAGWKAFIDGKEAPYLRANYVLRAMIVPAGDHEIKFYFAPSSYRTGNKISLASSVLLIILVISYFASGLLKKKNKE
jgi:hypothetical protein